MIEHGTATKTSALVLSNATVMLGNMGEGFNLTPAEHSIGLFKEATVNAELSYTGLTQGIRQSLIDEQITAQNITISGSGYQFGLSQIKYALGMDGHGMDVTTVQAQTTLAATETATALTLDDASDFTVGDTLVISPRGDEDASLVAIISAISTNTVTLDRPLAMAVPSGSKVYKGQVLRIGGDSHVKAYKSMKVVAHTTKGLPITFIVPKVAQSNSFTMALGGDYAKLPFTFKSFALSSEEAGYAEYVANDRSELIYIATT